MIEHKQEIEKMIEDVKAVNNAPTVAIFTSNSGYYEALKQYFPDVRVKLVNSDYLPDSNTCYIVALETPIKLIETF